MKMNNATVVIIVVIAFVIGIGAGYVIWHRSFPPGGFHGATTINSSSVAGTPFSSFRFASSSYQISGNPNMSASGKIATGDFNLTETNLTNGSIEYSMKFDEVGTTYNVTLKKSDTLYWIDTNLADDMPGSDISFGDDGYVAVNTTGYIVAFRYPLAGT